MAFRDFRPDAVYLLATVLQLRGQASLQTGVSADFTSGLRQFCCLTLSHRNNE